jgi:hypothetical protein
MNTQRKQTREIVEHALNPTYLRQSTMANLQGFKGIFALIDFDN